MVDSGLKSDKIQLIHFFAYNLPLSLGNNTKVDPGTNNLNDGSYMWKRIKYTYKYIYRDIKVPPKF